MYRVPGEREDSGKGLQLLLRHWMGVAPKWVATEATLSSALVEAEWYSKSCQFPSLYFEPDSVKRSLQEMDGAVVGVDDELAIVPVRVFVSADQKLQGEAGRSGTA
jgi:hypothetical protein